MSNRHAFSGTSFDLLCGVLAALLVLRLIGSILAGISLPIAERAYADANYLLDVVVAAVNFASVVLAFIALRWAKSQGGMRILSQNEPLLSAALLATVVAGMQIIVNFLFARLEWLIYVPVANAAPIDLHALAPRMLVVGIVLPALLLYLVLRIGARRNPAGSAG